MADLDDFFAKKDKKKSKGKKLFTTTEEIAKRLDEKKTEKPKKDKPSYQSSGQNGEKDGTKAERDEEEWKEFEEEKKDYTGLKIQNLNLQEDAKSDNAEGEVEGGELEENEQGELVRKKKGPWKALAESEGSGGAPPAPAPAAKAPQFFRPRMVLQAAQGRSSRAMGSTVAPDIMNQDFFPTLSAASNETPTSWNKKKQEAAFEEARNSKSHTNRESRVSQRLEIGNKFGALQNENS